MRCPSHRCLRRQVDLFRRQFLQEGGLPFTDVLTEESLSQALETIRIIGEHVIPQIDKDHEHSTSRYRRQAGAKI